MSILKFASNLSALSGAKILSVAGQFLVLPILAKYLTPEDYGIVAISMVFLSFTMIISDSGLGGSLVKRKAYDPDEWNSAFWFVLMIGVVMSSIMLLISPFVSLSFHHDELKPIMIAIAIIPLIKSSIVVPQAEMQRRGDIRNIAIGELIATFFGFIVAIVIAVKGGGAWALIWQQITFWVIRALNIHMTTQLSIKLAFSFNHIHRHLTFGRDSVIYGLVQFFQMESQNLLIGKVIGTRQLGIYSMSNRFAELPNQMAMGPLYYVLYVNFSKISDKIVKVGATVKSIGRLLAVIALPGVAVLAAGGSTFFPLFLSAKWVSVAWIFAIIAPVGLMKAILAIYDPVLMSMGRTDLKLRLGVEMTLYWLVILFITVGYGITAVAFGYLFWFLSYIPRLLSLFLPAIGLKANEFLEIFILPVLISVVVVALHLLVSQAIHDRPILILTMMPFEVLLAWLALFYLQKRQLQDDFVILKKLVSTE